MRPIRITAFVALLAIGAFIVDVAVSEPHAKIRVFTDDLLEKYDIIGAAGHPVGTPFKAVCTPREKFLLVEIIDPVNGRTIREYRAPIGGWRHFYSDVALKRNVKYECECFEICVSLGLPKEYRKRIVSELDYPNLTGREEFYIRSETIVFSAKELAPDAQKAGNPADN